MQWRVFWSNGCPLEPVKSIPIERFKRTPEEIKSKKEIFSSKAELSYTKSYYRGGRNFKVYPYSKLDDSILPGYSTYYNKYTEIVSERYPELSWGLTEEW